MNESFPNCTGGSAGFIDKQIFGIDHIYKTPSARRVYQTTEPYDPEGLLGTFMACLTVGYLFLLSMIVSKQYHFHSLGTIRMCCWKNHPKVS